MEAQTSIARHYGDGTDLERRVEEELGAAVFASGKELSPQDVAGLDQFHLGGAEATEDLADCSLACRRSTYWMSKTPGRRFGMRPQTATSCIEFDT